MPRLKTGQARRIHLACSAAGKAAAKMGIGRPERHIRPLQPGGLPVAAQARSLTRISPARRDPRPAWKRCWTASPKKSVSRISRMSPTSIPMLAPDAASGRSSRGPVRPAAAGSPRRTQRLCGIRKYREDIVPCVSRSPARIDDRKMSEHLHAADQGECARMPVRRTEIEKSVMSSTSAARVTRKVLRIRARSPADPPAARHPGCRAGDRRCSRVSSVGAASRDACAGPA